MAASAYWSARPSSCRTHQLLGCGVGRPCPTVMLVAVNPLMSSTFRAIPKSGQQDSLLTVVIWVREQDVGGLDVAVQQTAFVWA